MNRRCQGPGGLVNERLADSRREDRFQRLHPAFLDPQSDREDSPEESEGDLYS